MMPHMRDERSAWSVHLLLAGPVLQLGGWGAAFTDIGAVFVLGGTAMSLLGFSLKPTRWRALAAVLGIVLGGWGLIVVWALAAS
jgi:hypothetical protein